jgi:streptogramin lyase
VRSVTLRVALVAAVLVAVLLPALATGSSSRGSAVRTMHTIQQAAAYTSVDADHDGTASIGDYSVAQVVHLDPTTGKQIGTGVAICTQVTADGSLFDCQGSDVLPGGELREAGRFTIGKTWHLSILGGSGRYDGASGSVDGTWLDPQLSRSRDVFTIRTEQS